MKEFSICFNVEHPKVIDCYDNRNNYKIQLSEDGDPNLCAIYFTSHALYYPNTESEFTRSVLESDRYEWYKSRHLNAGKHIFVRDVFKQWYLKGINGSINSPDLLLRFLKHQTEGMEVVTIGASAGGYAAILYGCMLNAKSVLAFNPQINLYQELTSSSESENLFLYKFKNTELSKFYNLNNCLSSNTDIFYVYSTLSQWDLTHCGLLCQADNIHRIPIRSNLHGVPVPMLVLREFISSKRETLLRFARKENRQVRIMIYFNFRNTIIHYIKIYTNILKTKLCR